MTARILLIRHAASAHVHDGKWLHHSQVHTFEDAYDAAGIKDDSVPPHELLTATADADLLCASDLPRAVASARRLARERSVILSPLFREIRLEPPRWIPFPLPIETWDLLSHTQWTLRLLAKSDHEFVRRAAAAVDWLEEHGRQHSTIGVVTHAAFRRLLAARLVATGWRRSAGRLSYANWSSWELVR